MTADQLSVQTTQFLTEARGMVGEGIFPLWNASEPDLAADLGEFIRTLSQRVDSELTHFNPAMLVVNQPTALKYWLSNPDQATPTYLEILGTNLPTYDNGWWWSEGATTITSIGYRGLSTNASEYLITGSFPVIRINESIALDYAAAEELIDKSSLYVMRLTDQVKLSYRYKLADVNLGAIDQVVRLAERQIEFIQSGTEVSDQLQSMLASGIGRFATELGEIADDLGLLFGTITSEFNPQRLWHNTPRRLCYWLDESQTSYLEIEGFNLPTFDIERNRWGEASTIAMTSIAYVGGNVPQETRTFNASGLFYFSTNGVQSREIFLAIDQMTLGTADLSLSLLTDQLSLYAVQQENGTMVDPPLVSGKVNGIVVSFTAEDRVYQLSLSFSMDLKADQSIGFKLNSAMLTQIGVATPLFEMSQNEVSVSGDFVLESINQILVQWFNGQAVNADTASPNLDPTSRLLGTVGNDTFKVDEESRVIDGGAGLDTAVFFGTRSDYRLQVSSGVDASVARLGNPDQSVSVFNIERLRFSDVAVALDIEDSAGEVYRLYQAAFGRTPDYAGLGYWIAQRDSGIEMISISERFIKSDEFDFIYGVDSTNAQFLTKLYQNVLGRDPDLIGYNWWLNELNTNPSKTKAKVLADFAESGENQAGVASLIGSGITYEPWMG